MIDNSMENYANYCKRMTIPDIYGSGENFLKNYPYNSDNPDSIISNITRAYDNAVVLRNEIGTETLSYIQMTIYDLKKSETSESPLIELQGVLDDLLAFWGCVDDEICSPIIRGIIKVGRRIERLDMYLRMSMPDADVKREYSRLITRLDSMGDAFGYDHEALEEVGRLLDNDTIPFAHIYPIVESIVNIDDV